MAGKPWYVALDKIEREDTPQGGARAETRCAVWRGVSADLLGNQPTYITSMTSKHADSPAQKAERGGKGTGEGQAFKQCSRHQAADPVRCATAQAEARGSVGLILPVGA